jgi:hypothetical protein
VEARRHRQRVVEQARLGHDVVDDAEGASLLDIDLARREHQLLGAHQPDHARQQVERAEVGHQADAGEHRAEARARRGEHEVAGQRQDEAGAEGRAVDRRDHRLLEVDQFAEPDVQTPDAVAVGEDRALLGRQRLQVAAGAERAAGPGDDDGAHLGGVTRLVHRLGDALAHFQVEGVARFRLVESDDECGAVALTQDGCGHGLNPRSRAMMLRWMSLVPSPIT